MRYALMQQARVMNFNNFSIRPIDHADAKDYFELVQNNRERIARYFPVTVRENTSLQATVDHIAGRVQRAGRREYITYLMFDNKTGRIAGTIFLKDLDWNIPKCELGFYIDKNYEGKGITSNCVRIVVEHCFTELKMNKLFMRIAEDNVASRRVAEKNGFKMEGTLRKDFKTMDGTLIDAVYYGLIKEEFKMRLPGN